VDASDAGCYPGLTVGHKGPLRDVLAKNMRRLRATRGLSQEALAHECGMGRTYLSGVERSERNVSIDNIARIARGLSVDAWKLLFPCILGRDRLPLIQRRR
jgi:transcriptional regulator with XRE-family HTH domain